MEKDGKKALEGTKKDTQKAAKAVSAKADDAHTSLKELANSTADTLAKSNPKTDKQAKRAIKAAKKMESSKATKPLLKRLKGRTNKAAKVGTTLAPSLLPIIYTAAGVLATYLKGRDD